MKRKNVITLPPFHISMCKAYNIPEPVKEHRFHHKRKFRFDYAWVEERVACELEGGIYSHGRHVRGSGYARDMEKYNAAIEGGWYVLRYEPTKIDYLQVQRVLFMRTKEAFML